MIIKRISRRKHVPIRLADSSLMLGPRKYSQFFFSWSPSHLLERPQRFAIAIAQLWELAMRRTNQQPCTYSLAAHDSLLFKDVLRPVIFCIYSNRPAQVTDSESESCAVHRTDLIIPWPHHREKRCLGFAAIPIVGLTTETANIRHEKFLRAN